ncbi:tail fiber assembly protein [Proteus mirabilis]|uniref:tail fiber assembly protein n=1 Tax=Proteus mirabilis TaxID=584 RepID=UPI0038A9B446
MKKYNLEITAGKIGQDGYVSQTGWVKTYYINEATREYIGATMEHVTIGGGLPAGAYLDAPQLPEKDDIAIIRSTDGLSWLYVTDYRAKTAYNTENRQPIEIDFIGDLPATLTLLEPKTEFDKWDGESWVADERAIKEAQIKSANKQKTELSQEAENRITQLERKVRLNMASDDEIELLKSWEIYTVNLDDVNPELAPDIEWPQNPE